MGSIPDYETAIAEVIRLEAELAEANRACTLAHEGENTCRNEMIRMHEDMHTMMLSRIEQEGIYQDKIKRLQATLRRYGRHSVDCPVDGPCICGLDDALVGKEET